MTVPRVHVKGFGDNGDKEELRRLFGQFGPLTNVWIATRPPGFAYVFFETFEDAEKAVEFYNGKEICGAVCVVDLSPIEDKPRGRREPVHRGGFHGESRRGSFPRERGREVGSGREARHGHERDGHHRRESYSREENSYRGRGRPFSRGGGGRGVAHDRAERRHSLPEHHGGSVRGGSSRGHYEPRQRRGDPGHRRGDHGALGHRHGDMGNRHGEPGHRHGDSGHRHGDPVHRERGHPEFETNSRHRSSSSHEYNSHSLKYEHNSRHHQHSRPEHYSEPAQGHIPREHHERGRPVRELSSRVPPEYQSHHRRLRTHSMDEHTKSIRDFEKPYRVKAASRHERHLSERGRVMERGYDDMEYRESRRLKQEEAQLRRSRKYELEYAPKKPHHRRSLDDAPPPRPSHRRSRTKYNYDTEEYFDPKVILKPGPIRERSPLSPQYINESYSHEYITSPVPSRSRSRSRSVASMSSDTSCGFSASPSPRRELPPPPNHRPGSSLVPASPGTPEVSPRNDYDHMRFSRSRSPEHQPVYTRSPSPQYSDRTPEYVIEPQSTELFTGSPLYNQPGTAESPQRYVEDTIHESREVEFGDYPPYKKSGRDVSVREKDDRKVSYNEKHGSKDRYIEVDTRRDGVDRKRKRSRIVSDSRDGLGSAHGSGHSSPMLRESSSKRRRSAFTEEDLKSDGRRQLQAVSPVSDRIVLDH